MICYTPPVNDGLEVIYQDEFIIVLNKPSGLLSVPGRGEDKQDCLVSRVKHEYPSALIIHRLDMSTSGIIVLALNKKVHRQVSELFAMQKIEKKYIAVVEGDIKIMKGKVNQPLICDWPNRPKQIISQNHGKPSLTYYRVIESYKDNNTCRVELTPKTGRTHQLRVHMQYLGHPILGDELYGSVIVAKKSKRLLLHATSIEFQHPVFDSELNLTSPVPF
ncbi:MAG: RluA family pseudouridine synthase [Thiohalomonadales bacterium]